MLSVSKGAINLWACSTKAVPDAAVVVSFDFDVNGCVLRDLCAGGSCDCYPKGAEEAALAYSMQVHINEALSGDPAAFAKSKVAAVRGVGHNGMFALSWNTKGTVSGVRKSIGIALKNLAPQKLFPIYSRVMKEYEARADHKGSASREVFTSVAADMIAGMKNINVGIVGNIKLDKDSLAGMLDVLVNKYEVPQISGSKEKPTGHKECEQTGVSVPLAGWQSFVFSDFVQSKLRGLSVTVCNKALELGIKPAQWDTQASNLKPKVAEFVKLKYGKIKEGLGEIVAYIAITNGALCGPDAKTMINALTVESAKAAINKGL